MSDGIQEYEYDKPKKRYGLKKDTIVTQTLEIGLHIQPKSPQYHAVQNFLVKLNNISPKSKFVLKTNRANRLYIHATGGETFLRPIMENIRQWVNLQATKEGYIVRLNEEDPLFMILSCCKMVRLDLEKLLEKAASHLSAELIYRDKEIIEFRVPLDKIPDHVKQTPSEWKVQVHEFLDQFNKNLLSYEKFNMRKVFDQDVGLNVSRDTFKSVLDQITYSLKSVENRFDYYFSRSRQTLEIFGYKSNCELFKDMIVKEFKCDALKTMLNCDTKPLIMDASSLIVYSIEPTSLFARTLANCVGAFNEFRDEIKLNWKLDLVCSKNANGLDCFQIVYNNGDMTNTGEEIEKFKQVVQKYVICYENEQIHSLEADMSFYFASDNQTRDDSENEFRKRLMHRYLKGYPENRYFGYYYSQDNTKLTVYGMKTKVILFWSEWVQPKLMYKSAYKLPISSIENRLLYLIIKQFGDNFKQEIADELDANFKNNFVCLYTEANTGPVIRYTKDGSSKEMITYLERSYLKKFASQTLMPGADTNMEQVKALFLREDLVDRDKCYIELVVNKDPRLAQIEKGPVRIYGLKHCVKQMSNLLQLHGLMASESENIEPEEYDSETMVYQARTLPFDILTSFDGRYLKDLATNLLSIFRPFYQMIEVTEKQVVIRYRKCAKLLNYLDLYFDEFSQRKIDLSSKAQADYFNYCVRFKMNSQRVAYKYDSSGNMLLYGMSSDVKKLTYMMKNHDSLDNSDSSSSKRSRVTSPEEGEECEEVRDVKSERFDLNVSDDPPLPALPGVPKSSVEWSKLLKLGGRWFQWEMLLTFDINQMLREENIQATVEFDYKLNEFRIRGPRDQNLQRVSNLIMQKIREIVVEDFVTDKAQKIIQDYQSNPERIKRAIKNAQLMCVVDIRSVPGRILIYSNRTSDIQQCKELLIEQVEEPVAPYLRPERQSALDVRAVSDVSKLVHILEIDQKSVLGLSLTRWPSILTLFEEFVQKFDNRIEVHSYTKHVACEMKQAVNNKWKTELIRAIELEFFMSYLFYSCVDLSQRLEFSFKTYRRFSLFINNLNDTRSVNFELVESSRRCCLLAFGPRESFYSELRLTLDEIERFISELDRPNQETARNVSFVIDETSSLCEYLDAKSSKLRLDFEQDLKALLNSYLISYMVDQDSYVYEIKYNLIQPIKFKFDEFKWNKSVRELVGRYESRVERERANTIVIEESDSSDVEIEQTISIKLENARPSLFKLIELSKIGSIVQSLYDISIRFVADEVQLAGFSASRLSSVKQTVINIVNNADKYVLSGELVDKFNQNREVFLSKSDQMCVVFDKFGCKDDEIVVMSTRQHFIDQFLSILKKTTTN